MLVKVGLAGLADEDCIILWVYREMPHQYDKYSLFNIPNIKFQFFGSEFIFNSVIIIFLYIYKVTRSEIHVSPVVTFQSI